jgi:hypothetical protein
MPSAAIARFNPHPHGPRRRSGSPLQDPKSRDIIEELRHARTQQYLQSQYPGRPEPPDNLPKSEFSPWPNAYDDQE